MDCYTEDFEKFLLSETAAFYKKKAAAWIVVRARYCTSACSLSQLLLWMSVAGFCAMCV